MIVRWSIGILIFVLTLVGIASQQFTPVPNQEIVFQFDGHTITIEEAEHAVALVKKQLHAIGADNIKVHEQEEGFLKITYFSDTDVALVKKLLSDEIEVSSALAFKNKQKGSSKTPIGKDSSRYNIDVYEIQSGHDTGGNLVGKNAIEQKSEQNRFFSPNLLMVLYRICTSAPDETKKEDYKFRKYISFSINETSHIIPEVRAGPIAQGILNRS